MQHKKRPLHNVRSEDSLVPFWSAILVNSVQQGMACHQEMLNYWNPQHQKDIASHTLAWVDDFAQFWSKYAQNMFNSSFESFAAYNRQAGSLSDAMSKIIGFNTLKAVEEKKPR